MKALISLSLLASIIYTSGLMDVEPGYTQDSKYSSEFVSRICNRIVRRFGDNITSFKRVSERVEKRLNINCTQFFELEICGPDSDKNCKGTNLGALIVYRLKKEAKSLLQQEIEHVKTKMEKARDSREISELKRQLKLLKEEQDDESIRFLLKWRKENNLGSDFEEYYECLYRRRMKNLIELGLKSKKDTQYKEIVVVNEKGEVIEYNCKKEQFDYRK